MVGILYACWDVSYIKYVKWFFICHKAQLQMVYSVMLLHTRGQFCLRVHNEAVGEEGEDRVFISGQYYWFQSG